MMLSAKREQPKLSISFTMDVVRQYVQKEVSISKQANVSQILESVKLGIKVK